MLFPTTQAMAALRGKPWCQETLDAALVALREDVNVAPTAPGGRGEYRNSLGASFLFKFYVHVSMTATAAAELVHLYICFELYELLSMSSAAEAADP
jgi:xanthine dehydrogenase iron-sulfur cluster and FAD-binding subunit A